MKDSRSSMIIRSLERRRLMLLVPWLRTNWTQVLFAPLGLSRDLGCLRVVGNSQFLFYDFSHIYIYYYYYYLLDGSASFSFTVLIVQRLVREQQLPSEARDPTSPN